MVFVMRDPRCHHCNCFGASQTTPIDDGELNPQTSCACWLLHLPAAPVSLRLLGPPSPLRHNTEIRPINNPTVASKCSSEKKSCTSLTLNQKLEMT